jgi:hypothetical protein
VAALLQPKQNGAVGIANQSLDVLEAQTAAVKALGEPIQQLVGDHEIANDLHQAGSKGVDT